MPVTARIIIQKIMRILGSQLILPANDIYMFADTKQQYEQSQYCSEEIVKQFTDKFGTKVQDTGTDTLYIIDGAYKNFRQI